MNMLYYEKSKQLQNKEQKNTKQTSGQKRQNGPYMEQADIEEQYYQPAYQAQDYSEQGKLEPQKREIKELIANGVMIVLSIALVINICVAISVINDMNYSWARKEDNFWYSINDGNYAPLLADAWTNRFSDVKETKGLEQCYAVAEYFEAASLYKAAEYTGNAEKKEKYAKIMEEKLAYFDDIMYIAEDINMKLGIE